MATKKISKRTTATKAYDTNGDVIRLLRTKLTDGYNSLTYANLREAIQASQPGAVTTTRYGEKFYRVISRHLERGAPVFYIGCHKFNLRNFNRILIAAGMRTTKKALAAGAGL